MNRKLLKALVSLVSMFLILTIIGIPFALLLIILMEILDELEGGDSK